MFVLNFMPHGGAKGKDIVITVYWTAAIATAVPYITSFLFPGAGS